ncbi:MAG: beta galactosidase jelly roll domain-containing protein [Chitinispirillaceae bacterium]|nr:beta galactosidase jelly roll domain-containing protein [Chitinispirillaceae bacterium]
MSSYRFALFMGILCFFALTVSAEFYPERIYKERKKVLFNHGWKFYRGNPSGTPSAVAFNDASWQTVNVPHSASYDQPGFSSELNHYHGDVWYRKTFDRPSAPHSGKLFIEFEGAMQAADVWLNGQKLGAHHVSGYTWFSFDMTAANATGNVIAVKLNNEYTQEIPPGNVGQRDPMNIETFPDFHIFSGLYRDVWLVSTDKIYIPLYGQQISTPTVSTSNATVRIKTVVKNEDASPKSVTLSFVITDSSNTHVTGGTLSAAIPAGQSFTFDTQSETINNPKLWSPASPYLYKVFTRILVDDVPVDDFVERFGIRSIDYSLTEGFKLNGTPTYLKAVCVHQTFAWVQNAIPNSRAFEEVKLIKDMGANMIRSAHYPRNPAFYKACDELGILLYVEVPTWGVKTASYPAIFWSRLDTCAHAMITVGYNHPSIIMWGLFNEPSSLGSTDEFNVGITRLNNTVHLLDSTRKTVMANTGDLSFTPIPDIVGVNYWISVAQAHPTRIRINTEYHPGWFDGYTCARCETREPEFAEQRWGFWLEVRDAKDPNGNNTYIGGSMWSFNDYSSMFITQEKPMGAVDFYRIPKQAYYLFRKNWTGVAEDNPSAGVTATRLSLEPDLTRLIADSCDISRVIIATRNASGALSNAPATVSVDITGPATTFDPTTLTTKCGKIAFVLKSTNTPGTIRIIARAAGLTPDTAFIESAARDTTPLPFIAGIVNRKSVFFKGDARIRKHGDILSIVLPASGHAKTTVALYTLQGKQIARTVVSPSGTALFTTRQLKPGYYCLKISDENGSFSKKYPLLHLR